MKKDTNITLNKTRGDKTMKYYAHKGNSSDNAFTTRDGQPTRTFMAFDSKKEREEAREKIWKESGHQKNLIDCKRDLVVEYYGNDFFVAPNNQIYSDYDAYEFEQEMERRHS